MFIKVKNSEGTIVPIMINAEYIRTVEPTMNKKACILLQDNDSIITQETFDKIVRMLRMQDVFVV